MPNEAISSAVIFGLVMSPFAIDAALTRYVTGEAARLRRAERARARTIRKLAKLGHRRQRYAARLASFYHLAD